MLAVERLVGCGIRSAIRKCDDDGDCCCDVVVIDDGCGSCLASGEAWTSSHALRQDSGVTSILHVAPSLHQHIVEKCTFDLFSLSFIFISRHAS